MFGGDNGSLWNGRHLGDSNAINAARQNHSVVDGILLDIIHDDNGLPQKKMYLSDNLMPQESWVCLKRFM